MDIHIAVSIQLDYLGTLPAWSTVRLLSREARDIVATKPYELDLAGAQSFIATHTCMVCDRHVENPRWFTYKYLPPPRQCYIVSCHHYHCQVSSIYSMVADLASMNVHVLKRPFQPSNNIVVPRSDGSETPAQCVTSALLCIRGAYHVMTYWGDLEGYRYDKNVPWSHYRDHAPELVTINETRPMGTC